jgi:hypothetical protein
MTRIGEPIDVSGFSKIKLCEAFPSILTETTERRGKGRIDAMNERPDVPGARFVAIQSSLHRF